MRSCSVAALIRRDSSSFAAISAICRANAFLKFCIACISSPVFQFGEMFPDLVECLCDWFPAVGHGRNGLAYLSEECFTLFV